MNTFADMTRAHRILPGTFGPAPVRSAAAPSMGAGALGRAAKDEAPDILAPESLAAEGEATRPAPQPGSGPTPRKDAGEARDVALSVRRGWRRTCPACGGGPLYDGYLTVRGTCPSCEERLDLHRADDLPTWMTIIVVGHLVAPLMLTVWETWDPPIWVHWTLWPPMALLLSLWLLPRFKGVVVGLQWAKRMAGFGAAGKD